MIKKLLLIICIVFCAIAVQAREPFMQFAVSVPMGNYWANWDETTEASLKVDQDNNGTEDTFICFMENTTASGDETGRGAGLSGANLVGTEAGNLAGATGSPPSRAFDGANDEIAWTVAAMAAIIADNNYTFVWKWGEITDNTGRYVSYLASANELLNIWPNAAKKLELTFKDSVQNQQPYGIVTADDVPTTGIIHFALWSDGIYVRFGFTTGNNKPDRWSDFATGKRVSWTVASAFTPDFNAIKMMSLATVQGMQGDGYYFMASKLCLINNNL